MEDEDSIIRFTPIESFGSRGMLWTVLSSFLFLLLLWLWMLNPDWGLELLFFVNSIKPLLSIYVLSEIHGAVSASNVSQEYPIPQM